MDHTQILEHIRIAIAEVLNQKIDQLSEDARLFEDLALDSTMVIELLMALEDTTALEIDPDELEPEVFHTVRSLAEYVQAGLTRRAA